MKSLGSQDIEKSLLFDANWYLARYPDVKKIHLSPAEHYLRYGWKMGRDPGPNFSTLEYLEKNPSIDPSINPLLDYIRDGKGKEIYPSKEQVRTQVVMTSEVNENLGILPLVSVVMPVYNVGPYLDASIMSVLNQSYKNIELIIVNDASTDNSINVIRMYEAKDDRIKVHDLEFNTLGGAGIPSNVGFDAAVGEYIACADSDDILDAYAIEKMVALAQQENVDVVLADFALFSNETRVEEGAYDKARWKGIPLNQSIQLTDYPILLNLSPVPWRKLYRTEFMNKNKIRFPEGDYFYEDNPLHWFVLSQADSIAMLDHTVALHRMEREGQTMGSDAYKLAAQFCHMGTVRHFFEQKGNVPSVVWNRLVEKSKSFDWVINKESDPRVAAVLKQRNAQLMRHVLEVSGEDPETIQPPHFNFMEKLEKLESVREKKDLTIIVPIYNCEDLLGATLEQLSQISGLSYEVFMVDDGSEDKSREIAHKYSQKYENFLLFEQKNRGAGVARNAVIPIATGTYTYFLDADDSINSEALVKAVQFGEKNGYDLVLFKYRIHFFDQNSYKDMFESDQRLWEQLSQVSTNLEKQKLAVGLINYPWVRIIKTQLLHDETIFFGKTVVHNDIPFHWHSIVAAKNIGTLDAYVCDHRKFDTRSQITNIADKRRMMVFAAQQYTQRLIEKYPNFQEILPIWATFITNLLKWARNRIPADLQTDYENKRVAVQVKLRKLQEGENPNRTPSIGFYRIVSNVVPRVAELERSLDEIELALEQDAKSANVTHYLVMNRLTEKAEKDRLRVYCNDRGIQLLDIRFNVEEFKKCGYDFSVLSDGYDWFKNRSQTERAALNLALRRPKSDYLLNLNGARNSAILNGKLQYDWALPWDTKVPLTSDLLEQLEQSSLLASNEQYVLLPTGENASVHDIQVAFKQSSVELFSTNRSFGNSCKAEFFNRIGASSVTLDQFNWQHILPLKSTEYKQFIVRSAANTTQDDVLAALTADSADTHSGFASVSDYIDRIEGRYVEKNHKSGKHLSRLKAYIEEQLPVSMLKKKFDEVVVQGKKDINKVSSADRVGILLYGVASGELPLDYAKSIDMNALKTKPNVDLYDCNKFSASFNNTTAFLLVSLLKGHYGQAVSAKLTLVMLQFFHYSSSNFVTLHKSAEKNISVMAEIAKIFLEELFEYDVNSLIGKVSEAEE